jgi:hypothetical protein
VTSLLLLVGADQGYTTLRRPANTRLPRPLFVVLGVIVCIVVSVAHVKWPPAHFWIKPVTIVRPMRLVENVLVRKRPINIEEAVASDRLYFSWRQAVSARRWNGNVWKNRPGTTRRIPENAVGWQSELSALLNGVIAKAADIQCGAVSCISHINIVGDHRRKSSFFFDYCGIGNAYPCPFAHAQGVARGCSIARGGIGLLLSDSKLSAGAQFTNGSPCSIRLSLSGEN